MFSYQDQGEWTGFFLGSKAVAGVSSLKSGCFKTVTQETDKKTCEKGQVISYRLIVQFS